MFNGDKNVIFLKKKNKNLYNKNSLLKIKNTCIQFFRYNFYQKLNLFYTPYLK
jgi:hypothetical protein